jgi:hypothetical protein
MDCKVMAECIQPLVKLKLMGQTSKLFIFDEAMPMEFDRLVYGTKISNDLYFKTLDLISRLSDCGAKKLRKS